MKTSSNAVEKLRQQFKAKIEQSVEYRHRVLMALYQAQTAVEKAVKKSNTLNGVGFGKIDAEKLSRVAEKLNASELLEQAEEAYLRRTLPKYWGQFLRLHGLHELPGVGLKLVKSAAPGGSDLKEAA
jgi:hypothetical protein